MQVVRLGLASAMLVGIVSVAHAAVVEWTLHNSPGGNAPGFEGEYGLRLDSENGQSNGIQVFNFETTEGVTGTLDTVSGLFTIEGVVENLQENELYDLSATIQITDPLPADVASLFNPTSSFVALNGFTDYMLITPVSGGNGTFLPAEWVGYPGAPNFHIDTGYRTSDDLLSGYGWLEPAPVGGGDHVSFQDWIFTMKDPVMVPLPPAAGLMGLGLLGVALYRRVRKS